MQPNRIIRICPVCGGTFSPTPTQVRKGWGHFCSVPCRHKGAPRAPIAERFWAKVDKDGPIPPHRSELGPCWLWTGYRNPHGYGGLNEGGRGHCVLASRVSWELHNGPIPDGM